MYSNGYGGSPDFSNNPFINDPRNPHTRFPDISGTISPQSSLQTSQWGQQSPYSTGSMGYQSPSVYQQQPQYQQQQPSYQQGGYGQMQQQPQYGQSPGLAPQATGMPFQPSSSFGQQLAATVSGSSYGYLNGQGSNPSSQQGYNPAQQQLQSPSYVAQFDPYSGIGQGWDGSKQSRSQPSMGGGGGGGGGSSMMMGQPPASPPQSYTTTTSPNGQPHPREFLRTHKREIDAWDNYAWKQLFSLCDALKGAWEARAKELLGQVGQYQAQLQFGNVGYYAGQIQQEKARLEGLVKEAQTQSDSVAASRFQLDEVHSGYRQSSDLASKRRVREASNAALTGLPDWPQPFF